MTDKEAHAAKPILAKLQLPRLAQGIKRERLFHVLNASGNKPVTWISGPGGSGKTTLAATYLQEVPRPYLWYQIEGEDSDPATLFYYLGIAAEQALPGQRPSLPLLTAEYLGDITGFARRYFRRLYVFFPDGLTIVFDNFQEAADNFLLIQILSCALGEMTPRSRLLILSREQPNPKWFNELLHHNIAFLGWDDIRLTLDETRSIVRQQYDLDERSVNDIHKTTDGWAAGVTLMVEKKGRGLPTRGPVASEPLDTIFSFFATEFFDALGATEQTFLIQTALPLHITPRLAEDITGERDADVLLRELHERQFFIHRRDLSERNYQYHALLREFLLSQLYRRPSSEYSSFVRHTAQCLVRHGRSEEAIILFLQSSEWEMVVPLILSQAPQLVAQGRAQILLGWLLSLPDQLITTVPWLLYWKAISQVASNPLRAQSNLRQAYDNFERKGDNIGMLLSASAIIEITYFLRQSLLSASQWLEALQRGLKTDPSFPSAAVEARVLTSLVSMLVYLRPQDKELPQHASRLFGLLPNLDVNQRIVVGTHLCHYYTAVEGDLLLSGQISEASLPLLSHPDATPLNQIMWRVLSAIAPTLKASRKEAYETVTPLLQLIDDNGLLFMRGLGTLYALNVYENFNELDKALPLLSEMEGLTNAAQPADLAWLNVARCILALNQKDYTHASECGATALQLTINVGATLIEMEIRCLLAIVYAELGDFDLALEHLAPPKALAFVGSPRIKREALQAEAYVYLKAGRRSQCCASLREAFSIAKERGYYSSWLCSNRIMASHLCAEAIRSGIELEYVYRLVRMRELLPHDSTLVEWPWPIKIYCLGELRIFVDGRALDNEDVGPKPCRLLQLVVAFGGIDVRIDRLLEILWPDAEGDAAVSVFTTTAARLRKWIGDDAISILDARISITRRRCWVDALALDHCLDNAKPTEKDGLSPVLQQIIDLYRGPFLAGEDAAWAKRFRHKLRKKISQCFRECLSLNMDNDIHHFWADIRKVDDALIL